MHREDAVLEDYLEWGDRVEAYGLWYEYLKQNEYYKDFCWLMKRFHLSDLYNPGNYKGHSYWKQFTPSMMPKNWQTSIYLLDKEKLKGYKYLSELPEVFYYWGDIFSTKNFDAWKTRLAGFNDTYRYFFDPESPFYPDISYSYDMSEYILRKLMMIEGIYYQDHHRAPTLDEVTTYLHEHKRPDGGYLNLSVPLDMPLKELQEKCMKIIKEEKKKNDNDPVNRSMLHFPPIKPFRGKKAGYKEKIISLRECLEVYKERQNNPKMPWWEIAGKLEAKGIKLGDNFEVSAIQRLDNAITLIKNTGRNKFPDYGR